MSRVGDGSSIFDYMPISGPIRAFGGDGGDDDAGILASNSPQASGERSMVDGYAYWRDENGNLNVEGDWNAAGVWTEEINRVDSMLQGDCEDYSGEGFLFHQTEESKQSNR